MNTEDIKLRISKLNLKKDEILVIKFEESENFVCPDHKNDIRQSLKEYIPKETVVIMLDELVTIETLPDKEMNKQGWYKVTNEKWLDYERYLGSNQGNKGLTHKMVKVSGHLFNNAE